MRILLSVAALSILAMSGCGPMGSGPMPPRLDDAGQKHVDDSWNRALTPVDKLDRQAVLDALIVSQAYQAGVDRLEFHSEKKCTAGTVIMEIHFDRARPDADRFTLKVVSGDGRVLRDLTYNRKEVEETYRDLNDPKYDPNRQPPRPLNADEAQKRDDVKKRVEAAIRLFPGQEQDQPAQK